jgi:hypothetical protein
VSKSIVGNNKNKKISEKKQIPRFRNIILIESGAVVSDSTSGGVCNKVTHSSFHR